MINKRGQSQVQKYNVVKNCKMCKTSRKNVNLCDHTTIITRPSHHHKKTRQVCTYYKYSKYVKDMYIFYLQNVNYKTIIAIKLQMLLLLYLLWHAQMNFATRWETKKECVLWYFDWYCQKSLEPKIWRRCAQSSNCILLHKISIVK